MLRAFSFFNNLAGPSAESVQPEEKIGGGSNALDSIEVPVEASAGSTLETTQAPKPAATPDELPIGEAIPAGEHVRSLRVFSCGGEAGSGAAGAAVPRASRQVQILRIFRDPDVCVAPDLIGKPQCEHLLQLAEGKWTRSKTSIGMSTAPQVSILRAFTPKQRAHTQQQVFLSLTLSVTVLLKAACLREVHFFCTRINDSHSSHLHTPAPLFPSSQMSKGHLLMLKRLLLHHVYLHAEYTTTESSTRTSKSVILQEAQTPGVVSVELLASALAQMPLQHLEGLVLVKYDEGEYFNEHHDGAFRPKTVLLYLNEVEGGGYTHFTRLGLQIAPAAGCGAVWGNVTPSGCMDTRTLHAGVPPTKGTKYVVNCFFNESVVRFAQPEAPLCLPGLETRKKAGGVEAAAEGRSGEKENAANNLVCSSNAPVLTPRTLLCQRREHTEHQLHVQRSAAPAPTLALPAPFHCVQQQPFPASAAALQQQAWGAAAVLQLSRHLQLQNAAKAAANSSGFQVPFAPTQPPFMMSAPPSPFGIGWVTPPPHVPMPSSFGPAAAAAPAGPMLVSGPAPPAV
ncbi:hypothetical protein Esti_001719 [Eimeria stiedai]